MQKKKMNEKMIFEYEFNTPFGAHAINVLS